jgi:hypothetical protein
MQIKGLKYVIFDTHQVATVRLIFKVRTTSIDSLTNMIDMKEWVAPESNKTEASNPSIATVPITSSYSPSVSPGISK